jgi:hypothetical protein
MQHLDKHTYNICLKAQIKYWEQTLATYVYNHCNIPDLLLQHSYETLETYLRKHLKHLKHILSAQHLIAAWENGGSSACRRQQPGGTCRWRATSGGLATATLQRGGEAATAWLREGNRAPCHPATSSRWREAPRSDGEGRDRLGGEGRSRSLRW